MLKLHKHTKDILETHWDPIGVSNEPKAQGEYDAYFAQIAQLIQSGASRDDIAATLLKIECEEMGLQGDGARTTRVATKLADLKVIPTP